MKIYEQITPETWCKNMMEDHTGARCSLGWMLRMCPTLREYTDKLEVFKSANRIENIAYWNDTPGRTFEQVRRAFRKADL